MADELNYKDQTHNVAPTMEWKQLQVGGVATSGNQQHGFLDHPSGDHGPTTNEGQAEGGTPDNGENQDSAGDTNEGGRSDGGSGAAENSLLGRLLGCCEKDQDDEATGDDNDEEGPLNRCTKKKIFVFGGVAAIVITIIRVVAHPCRFLIPVSQSTRITSDTFRGSSIPKCLGRLTALTHLQLDNIDLTGTIPTQLGRLTGLLRLELEYNDLTGTIPSQLAWLGQSTALTHLHLDNNELTGTIPSQLGQLTRLTGLDLAYNELAGTIPSQLGQLTAFSQLYVQSNQLTGTVPSFVADISTAYVPGNNFTNT